VGNGITEHIAGLGSSELGSVVGLRIKELRLRQGLSRRDFARTLGVSAQQIHKYETGKDAVPLRRLLVLASLYDVAPDFFWRSDSPAMEDNSAADDSGTLRLMRAYRKIADPQMRLRVLRLVTSIAGEAESAEAP